MCCPADWLGLGKLCVLARQKYAVGHREIGRANGSVFLWAVIDTDPRNADDLSTFQSPEFWYGQG